MATLAGLREDAAMTEQPQQPAGPPVSGEVVVGEQSEQPSTQPSTESIASPAKVMRI